MSKPSIPRVKPEANTGSSPNIECLKRSTAIYPGVLSTTAKTREPYSARQKARLLTVDLHMCAPQHKHSHALPPTHIHVDKINVKNLIDNSSILTKPTLAPCLTHAHVWESVSTQHKYSHMCLRICYVQGPHSRFMFKVHLHLRRHLYAWSRSLFCFYVAYWWAMEI